MPPAILKAGPDLTIQIDNPSKTFHPGSVVTGRVIRRQHAVSPMATVEIRLLGRAKVKLGKTRSNGQTTYTTYYRGRFNFFDGSTMSQLHNGPLHIAQGGPGETWPFAIQVPLNPSPGALLAGHNDPKSSFLPLRPNSIASSPLPGSFVASGRSLRQSTSFKCYVEYHLEAVLLQQSSHGSSSTATLPLTIQPQPAPAPLASLDIQRQARNSSVSTYRLVPGMEDAHLSFKQKTNSFFHSSKVPGLHFKINIHTPGIIQLDHPLPVPFRISLVPNRQNSSDVLYDAPQTAVVTSLELILKAHTHVVAPGNCGYTTYKTNDSVKHRIILPIHAPVVVRPASSKSMDSSPVDPDGLPAYEKDNHPTVSDKKEPLPAYSPKPQPGASEEDAGASSSRRTEDVPHVFLKQEPLVVPMTWDQDGSQMVDIGAVLDLRIHRTHVTALGRTIATAQESAIHPGFVTYCIQHSHSLKWKLGLMIAGESVKLDGELPVSVVGPSQS